MAAQHNQAANTWVQPEAKNLVSKLNDFPIQNQAGLMSQTQIESKLKEQREVLESKYSEMISNQKQENESKLASSISEKNAQIQDS
jgi:hypothetical protein